MYTCTLPCGSFGRRPFPVRLKDNPTPLSKPMNGERITTAICPPLTAISIVSGKASGAELKASHALLRRDAPCANRPRPDQGPADRVGPAARHRRGHQYDLAAHRVAQ